MANTLTNTLYTILTNAALEAFTRILTPLMVFAKNYSDAAVERGDKVKVLFVPESAVAIDFVPSSGGTAGAGYTRQNVTATGLDIVINRHKFVSWSMSDTELSLNPIVNIETFGRQTGAKIAEAVLTDIWSLVPVVANYPLNVVVGPANAFDSDSLIDIKEVCDLNHWSRAGRNVILSSQYFNGLLKDGSLKNAMAYGGPEAIRRGDIPALVGFGVYDSTEVPTDVNLVGFATLPDSILVAMRYLAPQQGNTYFQAAPVSNEYGFTLGFRDFYDNNLGQRVQVLEANYGFLLGNPNALVRLVSA